VYDFILNKINKVTLDLTKNKNVILAYLFIVDSACVFCQVRKTSHAAMLLLLEHRLISKGTQHALPVSLPYLVKCKCLEMGHYCH